MSATVGRNIAVEYIWNEVTEPNPIAREQISTMVWAALRKQEYVDGTRCRVHVVVSDGRYDVEAQAKEPTTAWLRVLDLSVPIQGVEAAEFTSYLEEMGLAAFAAPPADAVLMGGAPGAEQPDTLIVNGEHRPVVGRNDLCPCGSGKKFKKCCLQ